VRVCVCRNTCTLLHMCVHVSVHMRVSHTIFTYIITHSILVDTPIIYARNMQKHMHMQVHVFVNCNLCRGGEKEVTQEAQCT
jgi:hypothetical protein